MTRLNEAARKKPVLMEFCQLNLQLELSRRMAMDEMKKRAMDRIYEVSEIIPPTLTKNFWRKRAFYCAWTPSPRLARLVRWLNLMDGAAQTHVVKPPQAKSSITGKVETPHETHVQGQNLESQK